jgi:hypothetical protein
MMSLLIVAGLVVVALVWVLASPVRIAAGVGLAFVTHPALTIWLTAAVAVTTLTIAGLLVYRNTTDAGWRLVTVTDRPADAPASEAADRQEVGHG